jgi:hypothetical protein
MMILLQITPRKSRAFATIIFTILKNFCKLKLPVLNWEFLFFCVLKVVSVCGKMDLNQKTQKGDKL